MTQFLFPWPPLEPLSLPLNPSHTIYLLALYLCLLPPSPSLSPLLLFLIYSGTWISLLTQGLCRSWLLGVNRVPLSLAPETPTNSYLSFGSSLILVWAICRCTATQCLHGVSTTKCMVAQGAQEGTFKVAHGGPFWNIPSYRN